MGSTNWQEQNADPRMDKLTPDKRCLCRECGEFFNSVKGFTLHRYTGADGARLCRTISDLEGRGWFLDKDGFWRTERMPGTAISGRRRHE